MGKKLAIAGVVAVGALAGVIYWSPNIALASMGKAIDRNDATAFSEYVDFPALREDLKGKMMIAMARKMESPEMNGNPFAALGQMLAVGLVNQMVETMVSPAGVMLMLDKGKAAVPSKPGDAPPTPDAPKAEKRKFDVQYQGWSHVKVRPEGEDGGLTFRRDGLLGWKLISVDLPETL